MRTVEGRRCGSGRMGAYRGTDEAKIKAKSKRDSQNKKRPVKSKQNRLKERKRWGDGRGWGTGGVGGNFRMPC